MLNADDKFTPASLTRLKDAVRRGRPLVVWVGAGASRWAELPSWHNLAKLMRKSFAQSIPDFPNDLAESSIAAKAYPDLFQLCRDIDTELFNSILLRQFNAPAITPLYTEFFHRLRCITPTRIVTTNVDLCLEQQAGAIDVIERADVERCTSCILANSPFIAKLHGSISSIGSTIFTSSDYQQLTASKSYIAAIKGIFNSASVLFLGYGLQDKYVLKLIADNEGEHEVFGSGPHFLVSEQPGPPQHSVHRIGYQAVRHKDHRAILTVLDFVSQAKAENYFMPSQKQSRAPEESSFFISDFKPSGTHVTGNHLELEGPLGAARMNAIVGLGFVRGELPSNQTVAFHDLAVGLTCFDRVFLPLTSIGVLHERATSVVFWSLVDSGALRFVDVVHDPSFVSQPDAITGDIGVARLQDTRQEGTRSSMSVIRRMLKPVPGNETEGDTKIEGLIAHVISFADSEHLGLAAMVRSALLLPKVSRLLGFSDYVVPTKIPHWLAYPSLRFAHLVQTGLICDQLRIRAARVPFGGASLLSAAFSIKPPEHGVYDYASFVLAGAFGSNLSTYLEGNPSALLRILKFRGSAEGEAFRREISDRLSTVQGGEFSAAIDGGLQKAIQPAVLQAARNKFSTLLATNDPMVSTSALWANSNSDDQSLRLWRARSKELLLAAKKQLGVTATSPCLCGSGDSMRECCLYALGI